MNLLNINIYTVNYKNKTGYVHGTFEDVMNKIHEFYENFLMVPSVKWVEGKIHYKVSTCEMMDLIRHYRP